MKSLEEHSIALKERERERIELTQFAIASSTYTIVAYL